MKNLKKDLINKGWTIIKSEKINHIQKISSNFIKEIKTNSNLNKIITKYDVKNIEDMRKVANYLNDDTLNLIRKLYIKDCSFNILKSFSSNIKKIFGKKILIQKYPQIQVHIGYSNSTRTFPHSEIMAGHSPYTYNIWLPFHNVDNESGIFLIDDFTSVKLCDYEIDKKIKSREELLKKYQIFPKLKLGEALLFNPFVYHGSNYFKNKLARISVDVRFQKFSNPLFQKYNDFFTSYDI